MKNESSLIESTDMTSSETRILGSRRNFLSLGAKAGLLVLAGSAAGSVWKTFRFLIPGASHGKAAFSAGQPEAYTLGSVDSRWKDSKGVWIIRTLEGIYALAAVSPAGCVTEWIAKEQIFRCPCHGSEFYKSGVHFSGPKQKSLTRMAIQLDKNGEVVLDPARKFSQERGEWARSGSFLPILKAL